MARHGDTNPQANPVMAPPSTTDIQASGMLRSLSEIAQHIGTAFQHADLLKSVAQRLVELLRVDHVGIVVFDRGDEFGSVIAEQPDHGLLGLRIPLSGPHISQMKRDHRPIVLDRVEDAEQYGLDVSELRHQGIRSAAFLPMFASENLVGTVGLDIYYEYHTFTEDELQSALAVTAQLGQAIRHQQLLDELQQRLGQLEFLTDLGNALNGTFNRNEILNLIRDKTAQVIDVDLVSVALVTQDARFLELILMGEGEPEATPLAVESTALRRVIDDRQPMIISEFHGMDDTDVQLLAGAGMQEALCVPVLARNRVIGTLNFLKRQTKAFTAADSMLAEQIASHIGNALDNARLYDEATRPGKVEQLMNQLGSHLPESNNLQRLLVTTMQQIGISLGAVRARIRLQPPAGAAKPAAAGVPGTSDEQG